MSRLLRETSEGGFGLCCEGLKPPCASLGSPGCVSFRQAAGALLHAECTYGHDDGVKQKRGRERPDIAVTFSAGDDLSRNVDNSDETGQNQ